MDHPKGALKESSQELLNDTDNSTKKTPFLCNHKERVVFPFKLMEVLSNDNHSDVISWVEHGESFMIHDRKKFVTSVMPNYFKQTKFESFMRKLSRWGFRKEKHGPAAGAYYHGLFKRDNPELCLQMTTLHESKNESVFKRGYMQERISSPFKTTNNPSHRIQRELLLRNLQFQHQLESDLFDESLLEFLLLKRRRRENMNLRYPSALTENCSFINSAGSVRSNLLRKASQGLNFNDVTDIIPGQTKWTRSEALGDALDDEIGRTFMKSVLHKSDSPNPSMFSELMDSSPSSLLELHDFPEYHDILMEDMNIDAYL